MVVGIAPPGFRYPRQTEVWRPLGWDPTQHNRGARFFGVVARLAEGRTLEEASSEMDAFTTRLAQEFPATNSGWGASVVPLLHSELGRTRQGLLVLLGAVGFVLILACANVANLLMAQGIGRSGEVAIRTALGANRKRLATQFLAESLALALLGGAAGLGLAVYGVAALKRIVPVMVPRIELVGVDLRVLAFTLGVVVVTAFVFGTIPAWQTSKGAPSGGRTTGRRTRDVFVVTQVAIALLMLVGAGLLMRSFERLLREDPGFIGLRSVTFNLQVPSSSYEDWTEVTDFYSRLVERISAIEGVRGAGVTAFLPLDPGWPIPFTVKGRPPVPDGEEPKVQYHTVSPGYFRLMGIPLLRGRDLSSRDLAEGPGVVVVNDAARRRYWPDEDPVGARVLTEARQFGPLGRVLPESLELEVVGIVADVKNASLPERARARVLFLVSSIRLSKYERGDALRRRRGAARVTSERGWCGASTPISPSPRCGRSKPTSKRPSPPKGSSSWLSPRLRSWRSRSPRSGPMEFCHSPRGKGSARLRSAWRSAPVRPR